jgi:hypothetical protein
MAKSKAAALSIVAAPAQDAPKDRSVIISPPRFEVAAITIKGTSPYVQHKFSAKARNTIIQTQEEGSVSRKGKARKPKDFNEVYLAALYNSREGWHGIPASAFRNACISACRIVGFKMTLGKMSVFIEADGYDRDDNTPLVRIVKGEPTPHFAPARNANSSIDIRCRPMWQEGWEAVVRVRWDADQFSASDIANLLARAGGQVGVGEGRADSRMSCGLGWGSFSLKSD